MLFVHYFRLFIINEHVNKMNAEEQIIANQSIRRLKENTGLKAQWTPQSGEKDGVLHLQTKTDEFSFVVEVKQHVRLHHLEQLLTLAKKQKRFMVIARGIAHNVKQELKNKNIAYLQTNGDALIQEGNLIIMISGNDKQEAQEVKPKTNRAFTKTGLKVTSICYRKRMLLITPTAKLRKKPTLLWAM